MTTIDEYLANVPESQREELQKLRKFIQHTVPEAEEAISYAMPTFKYKGKNLIHFAAFKDHMSIFPTPGSIEAVGNQLDSFKKAKGTIQFTEDNLVPEPVIKNMLLARKEKIDSK